MNHINEIIRNETRLHAENSDTNYPLGNWPARPARRRKNWKNSRQRGYKMIEMKDLA